MNNKSFFKKILLVFVLICMTFVTTACDFSLPSNGGNTNPTPAVPSPNIPSTPKVTYPEIPVRKQTKNITDEEILGSNFFRDKSKYFNLSDDVRFVNLTTQKTIYIRYESNLDNEVKNELIVIVKYLQDILKIVDSSYNIILDTGTPGLFDIFCYDTIYIKSPDKKALETFEKYGALGATFRGSNKSPVVYINKNAITKTIIDGKNVNLARVLLHEVMHGFGFNHTIDQLDLLFSSIVKIEQNSNGRYSYRKPGTKTYVYVNDYFFFSDDEIIGLIEYLAQNKSFSEKAKLYMNLDGANNLNKKFEDMKSKFLSDTKSQSTTTKSPDILLTNQIVSMKDSANKYEVIINKNSVGSYTAILKDGTTFSGYSKIMNVSDSQLTSQIIILTDFIYEGKTIDLTLYAFRSRSGQFYQRWKSSDKGVYLSFADNTAKYIS